MPNPQHSELAEGRWYELSLLEQLGNIGSEVSRAVRAKEQGNSDRMHSAFGRAIELFDLTIADPRLKGRRKEICRAREVFCDFFVGDNIYQSTGVSLDSYFTWFAMAARR